MRSPAWRPETVEPRSTWRVRRRWCLLIRMILLTCLRRESILNPWFAYSDLFPQDVFYTHVPRDVIFKGDPWQLDFFKVGNKLQTFLLWESDALALRLLDQIICFLQPAVSTESRPIRERQQAEKKLAVAETYTLSFHQHSFKFLYFHVSLEMWFSWTIVFCLAGEKNNDSLITDIQSVPVFCSS